MRMMISVREALQAVLSKSQLMKFEVFERQKLRIVHENLVKEEKAPQIVDIILELLSEMNLII